MSQIPPVTRLLFPFVPCAAICLARMSVVAIGLMLTVLAGLDSRAQTGVSANRAPSDQVQAKLRQRGTLILRDASLIEALFAIKENWGINIVVGNDVKGAVNGAYTNAPLHEILDSILASQGYGYLAIGDSLVVMKLDHLGAMKPLFVTETIPLEYVPPEEIVKVIEFLLSPQGKAHAVPSSKSVVVLDFPERIRVVRERIAELDRAAQMIAKAQEKTVALDPKPATPSPLKAETFVLQFASPDETARVIELLLSAEGKVRAAASSRAVLVVDQADRLELIRARIAELERAAEVQQTRQTQPSEASPPLPEPSSSEQPPPPVPAAAATPAQSDPAGSHMFTVPGRTPPAADSLPGAAASSNPATAAPPIAGSGLGGNQATTTSPAGSGGGLALAPEEMEVAFFAPQYVKATSLADALSTLVGPYGQVSAIADENRIVVVDQPGYIRRIAAAVEKLDVPRRQVRIAAMIFDASLSDLENVGINWSHAVKGRNLTGEGAAQDSFKINSLTLPTPASGALHGAITFMSLSQHFDVTAVINALRTSRNSRLLADPTVVVSDQESARISIVTEIPYQQLTESALGGVIGTTAFREAGVTLEVTPHIARDGTVNMIVTPRFSVLTGFTEQDNQPIIAKREAQTVVRIANNQTLVIGGLRQRGKVRDRTAIPYLSDIKFIGHLFRQRSDEVRESELLVFLTPTILESGVFGTVRERAAFETGQCEIEQVRQEPCIRCAPREDRTLYKSDFFEPPPIVVEPAGQHSSTPGVDIYRLPPPSGSSDERSSGVQRPSDNSSNQEAAGRRHSSRPIRSALPAERYAAAGPPRIARQAASAAHSAECAPSVVPERRTHQPVRGRTETQDKLTPAGGPHNSKQVLLERYFDLR